MSFFRGLIHLFLQNLHRDIFVLESLNSKNIDGYFVVAVKLIDKHP